VERKFALFSPKKSLLAAGLPVAGSPSRAPELHASGSNDAECLTLPDECDTIIDLSCRTKMNPDAYFHRIVDCLIPEYPFLKQTLETTFSASTCLVGHGSRYDTFAEIHSTNRMYANVKYAHSVRNRVECIAPSETQIVLQKDRPNQFSVVQLMKNLSFAKEVESNSLELMLDIRKRFSRRNSSETVVVIVSRSGTRSFEGETLRQLETSLKSLQDGIRIQLYTGVENVSQTIELFYSAKVVVMFHGAAAANLIFCEDDTIVVELSLFSNFLGTTKWRSNAPTLRAYKPQIVLGVYYIFLETALPSLDSNKLNSIHDVDGFLKKQNNITLGDSELGVIRDFIQHHMVPFSRSGGADAGIFSSSIEVK